MIKSEKEMGVFTEEVSRAHPLFLTFSSFLELSYFLLLFTKMFKFFQRIFERILLFLIFCMNVVQQKFWYKLRRHAKKIVSNLVPNRTIDMICSQKIGS